MKRFWLIAGLLFLVSCSPNEADFKSRVPVSDPPIEKEISAPSAPQPEPQPIPPVSPPSIPQPIPPSVPQSDPQLGHQSGLPSEINLDVPFFSQAPDANWDAPWQEACEEAASTLAVYYATGKSLTKEQFKSEVLRLVDWENETYGNYEHTTIEQTARMIREALGFSDFEILENPTVDQMKATLAKGSVIVAPFSGKDLKNPFYSNGGPVYHMMVIRGYDSKNFITNDVGTKRGENFIYPYARIMETMHDWYDSDIRLGAKRVIVVRKK